VPEIKFKAEFSWALDGPEYESKLVIFGRYIWDPEQQSFVWKLGVGPEEPR
jgi:hypothetical protein